jgi:hypothetical protein
MAKYVRGGCEKNKTDFLASIAGASETIEYKGYPVFIFNAAPFICSLVLLAVMG